MEKLMYFCEAFDSCEELFNDDDIIGTVLCLVPKCGNIELKMIVGHTTLHNDEMLLHLINVQQGDDWEDVLDIMEDEGIEFICLSRLLSENDTVKIYPEDQLDDESYDSTIETFDPNIKIWECSCGNINYINGSPCANCESYDLIVKPTETGMAVTDNTEEPTLRNFLEMLFQD